jgi:predicted MFS family arabinose efflux permease
MVVKPNKNNTLPQDRGWAWAVAAAGFICHVVMHTSNLTNSLLFVDIREKYETSITTGSFIFMVHTIAFSLSSVLISTFILPKLEERRCLFIGGLICFTVSICVSFAPSIGAFIAIIAFKGIGHGFIVLPSIALIRIYFNKMKSRASMIPWCGACAASMVSPFAIRAAKREFGVSGAYFLLAAFELHLCIASLLLRPVSSYRFLPEDIGASLKEDTAPRKISAESDWTNDPQVDGIERENNVLLLPDPEGGVDVFLTEQTTAKIGASVEEKINLKVIDITDTTRNRGAVMNRERRNTFRGSVLTLDSEFGTALEVMAHDDTDSPEDKGLTALQKFYKASSLELWSYRWALLAILPGTVNIYLSSYLPTITNAQGATRDQAALLATITGAMDLISRICIGFILDTNVITPSRMLAICHLCLGVACHFFRLTSSFATLIPLIVFIGLFIGTRGPIITLLVLDVVGTKKMPQAYGIITMMSTLTGASFSPILSAIVEAMGSFIPTMHIVGMSYILCGVLLFMIPLIARLDIKHGRKSATQK